jgi:radical SAM-linked protein
MRLSLPFPLSLGFAGSSELGTVFLTEKIEGLELINKLNHYLPEDIKVLKAELIPNKYSPNNFIESFEYKVILKKTATIDNLAFQTMQLTKQTKQGNIRSFLVKDYLKSIKIEQTQLTLELKVIDQAALPLNELFEMLKLEWLEIERTKFNFATS